MKTIKLPVLFLLVAFCLSTQAQVAINKDGSAPATGSIFHVKGDNALQAMFIESSSGNVGISTINPETNLNIYSSADNNGLTLQTSDNTFKQGIRFRNSGGSYTWNIYRKDASSNHADLIFANGLNGDITALTDVVIFKDGGSVGIGTTNPDASAALEIVSTTKGLLLPTLTQSQMEAISSPASGTHIYNTDLKALCVYNGTKWDCMDRQTVFDKIFICSDQLIDYRDSTSYNTVKIGNQCWMAANLNIGTRIDGSVTPTNNGTIEKYCYNDDENNCDTYGGLYLWDELMKYSTTAGSQGICPTGWHIPTDAEWKTLEMELGMTQEQANAINWRGTDEGGKLKETGTAHWTTPNTGASNSSGFTALAAGMRVDASTFNYINNRALFWSSNLSGGLPIFRRLDYDNAQVYRSTSNLARGRSLRCLRD